MNPLDELLLNHGGWVTIDSFVGRHNSWTRSREVGRVHEGSPDVERSTVLHVLATIKWPDGIPEGKEPYWKDKNPNNETLDNIDLMTLKSAVDFAGERGKRGQGIPFPSDSKEYRDEYRRRNKDKFNAYSKRYQQKLRDEHKARRVAAQATSANSSSPQVDSYLSDMEKQLQEITNLIKEE